MAFSCKGRGVCPSCNTRRMVETAAQLADHVLPRVPVRQWVLSVPMRLRYHLQHDREEPRHRAVARYLWAMLLAPICEALPLSCPICHASTRIIAFINHAGTVRKILDHIGECTQPPRIAPARGPPLSKAAVTPEQARNDPQWDSATQPAPEIEFDQRIAW